MTEEVKKFFDTYTDFVTKVTSDPSLDLEALSESFNKIEENSSIKTPRLLTAALGLGSETGEFVEIQGTAEQTPISRQELDQLLAYGQSAIQSIIHQVRPTLVHA